MKLFQRLLVAPAALGLLAPMAANAAELNINGVSDYSASSEEVQGISNFSDVYPTDWAYQALIKLAERHGCNAANPTGSMTRYEAAALLNNCLQNVAQVNEEERRLLNEFGSELAVIKGRIEGLEAGIGGFEAGQFSTTTKLAGETVYTVGSSDEESKEAVVFNYDTRLSLNTSFTGEDLLKTRIRSGNFGAADNSFGSNGVATLETAYINGSDDLGIDRNYYQFPVGEAYTVTIGAIVRQDDMLAVWPSAYPADSVLDVLTYAGANSAYSLQSGPGAGVTYNKEHFSASVLFVSEEGTDAGEGLLTSNGRDDYTAQLAWSEDAFTVAAVYTVSDTGGTTGSALTNGFAAWGLSGVYTPDSPSEWIPTSISAGMGWKDQDGTDSLSDGEDVEDERTWTLGFQWEDIFIEGNTLGFAIGTAEGHRDDAGYDDPLAYEIFYKMAVSDNITVTPAFFQVQRDGEDVQAVQGGLIKTTFRF